MAVVISCDQQYFDKYAIPLIRSIERNTNLGFVHCSVVQKPWEKWQYACQRFKDALQVFDGEVVIVDADCLFLGQPDFPAGDVGLYLREGENEVMKIAAGLVVVRKKEFLEVLNINLGHFTGWFADQKALWKTYQEVPCDYFDVKDCMGFDGPTHPIWSPKGRRKNTQQFQEALSAYAPP